MYMMYCYILTCEMILLFHPPTSAVWNNLQQTPVSNDIVAPIRGRALGERMESIDGPELSALYHLNTLTALIYHNWRVGLVGYFNVVSGPFMTSWLVQAHSSDRGV